MSFVEIYRFRARMSKAALMQFLAGTPPGQYVLLAAQDSDIYGLVAGTDNMEYLCNECCPELLQMIEKSALMEASKRPDVTHLGRSFAAGSLGNENVKKETVSMKRSLSFDI